MPNRRRSMRRRTGDPLPRRPSGADRGESAAAAAVAIALSTASPTANSVGATGRESRRDLIPRPNTTRAAILGGGVGLTMTSAPAAPAATQADTQGTPVIHVGDRTPEVGQRVRV